MASSSSLSSRSGSIVTNRVDVAGSYNDHSVRNTTNNVHLGSQRADLLELKRHISAGAAHDSYARGGLSAPKCHPETRAAVQGQIMDWIGYGDQDKTPATIMWLSGPAGAGKTAIAGSIADSCQVKGWLAGSFFFSASSPRPDRRSKRCVVPTLAYHLAQQKNIPELRTRILSAITDTPSVFEKRLGDQIEILILKPLRGIPSHVDRSRWPKVIIIDGLDECGVDVEDLVAEGGTASRWSQEANQREVISILMRASKDPAFPFRIIIVSRPEPAIRDAISTSSVAVTPLFLDEKYDPDADIMLFLEAKFAEIRRRFGIPASWPSQQDFDTLLEQASGQFIYAATVIRFVSIDHGATPPQEQLRRVIQWKALGNSNALSALDSLYSGIIRTSPNPPVAAKWLLTIYKARINDRGRNLWSIGWFVGGFLESFPGEMSYLLGNLTSLVDLGPDQRGLSPAFSFYHKTLGDFLDDERRSGAVLSSELNVPASERFGLTVTETVVTNFISSRMHAFIKNRGPQGTPTLPHPGGSDGLALFLEQFCTVLPDAISPRLEYNADDADWWWSCLSHRNLTRDQFTRQYQSPINDMFARVHKDCRWYRCLDSCKSWRKVIMQHCTASGAWRLLPGARQHALGLGAPGSRYRECFLGCWSRRSFFEPLKAAKARSPWI